MVDNFLSLLVSNEILVGCEVISHQVKKKGNLGTFDASNDVNLCRTGY
jgi:hypothetical protein